MNRMNILFSGLSILFLIVLPEMKTPAKAQVEKAMPGHVIASVALVGTYTRRR